MILRASFTSLPNRSRFFLSAAISGLRNLLANVDPLENSFLGVSMVLLIESSMSSGVGSRVAHLLQKMVSVGLKNWHFGHWMDNMPPLNAYIAQKKDINSQNVCQHLKYR
jgi:hypothetical protein